MLRNSETAFLIDIDPPLAAHELAVVLARLRANWPARRLVELLTSSSPKVAETAARCLGYIGTMEHCDKLVAMLQHIDDQVAAAAEEAIWAIWMRAGSETANARLALAVHMLGAEQLDEALATLDALIADEETLAEAHHQRALVLHLLDQHEEAEASYERAFTLNPHHYAALAGLGHLYTQRNQAGKAVHYYRRALNINPRLTEIREILPDLETAIKHRIVA